MVSKGGARQGEGAPGVFFRGFVEPQSRVGFDQCEAGVDFDVGLSLELFLHVGCRAVEQVDDRGGAPARRAGTRRGEHVLEEAAQRGRLFGLLPGFNLGQARLFGGAARLHQADAGADKSQQQRDHDQARRKDAALVPPGELAEPVAGTGRARQHGLQVEIAPQVRGHGVGGLVAGLEGDPVEVAADLPAQRPDIASGGGGSARCWRRRGLLAQSRAGLVRIGLADDAGHPLRPGFAQCPGIEREHSREKLVEDDSQRVDVGAGIDVQAAGHRLLGGHVLGRADHGAGLGVEGAIGQGGVGRLGDAEVDDLGNGLAV